MSAGAPESRYRDGATVAAPLALVVGVFGVSFGVLARAAGLGRVAPVVMSATTFAGSAQFATVSILDTGGAALAAIVAALPERYRSAVVLRHVQGLSYAEAADVLEQPLGTTKSDVHRGLRLLREAFERAPAFVGREIEA